MGNVKGCFEINAWFELHEISNFSILIVDFYFPYSVYDKLGNVW